MNKSSLKCFAMLVKRELYFFGQEFFSRLIDISVSVSTWLIVFGFLMANTGLRKGYGVFILLGVIGSFGLFEIIQKATCLGQDVAEKKITNFLTLPISSSFVFVAIAVSWGITTFVLISLMLPLGKIILWNEFSLANVSWIKLFFIFLAGNLFYGFFALWVSSYVTSLRNVSWVWNRIISPLQMLCGFFYTWESVFAINHWVAYLHLLNPILYVMEGVRGAVLGQSGYLPFGVCFSVISLLTVVFGLDAVRKLKKHIDFV